MLTKLAPIDIPEEDRCLSGRDKLVALSFAVLVVLLGNWLIVAGVSGVYHDDGIYIISAKALAQGDGYRLIHLPDSPVQTKYPFFYPLILATIWKLSPSFPGNLLLMQWLTLLSGAAVSALAYLYLIRFGYCSRRVAAAALLLCTTSPSFLFFCSTCLSEMPFALCLITALWALDRHVAFLPASRKTQLFLGTLVALPLLCRLIGFVSILIVVLLALRHKRIMRWPSYGTALVALPFGVWLLTATASAHATPGNAYYTDYVGWWRNYGIPFLGRVLRSNAFDVCYGLSPTSQIRWTDIPAWALYGGALLGLAGLIILVRQIGKWRVLPMVLAAYLAVVLVWPWPPFRFLVPILPYLLAYSITAIVGIFRHKQTVKAGFILLGILTIINAEVVYSDIISSQARRYPAYSQSFGTAPVNWSAYEDMFSWIRQHTNPDDVLATGMDPMLYLYTGRRSFRPFVSRPSSLFYNDPAPAFGTLGEAMANIASYKARYLVLCPMPGFSEDLAYAQFVVESQKRYPDRFECVYLGKDSRFVIWRIVDLGQSAVGH